MGTSSCRAAIGDAVEFTGAAAGCFAFGSATAGADGAAFTPSGAGEGVKTSSGKLLPQKSCEGATEPPLVLVLGFVLGAGAAFTTGEFAVAVGGASGLAETLSASGAVRFVCGGAAAGDWPLALGAFD